MQHVKAPLGSSNVPSECFCHVHIDLVGTVPVSSGFLCSVTAIERYTRLPEALPLSGKTADAVPKAFLSVWVARFGCP
jgi:hypothetical protein